MQKGLVVGLMMFGLIQVSCSEEVVRKVSTIGTLAFDGVLTSEVKVPVEVLGATVKDERLSWYRV